MYSSITLKQFRSYEAQTFDFSPSVNIVVGKNGSGKTNLLEAVYVLSQGTSFRVSDKDLIQNDKDWFRIEGEYGEQHRSLTYKLAVLPAKQFILDGVRKQRLSHQQRVPLVLFEPEDLRLLGGSPQRRRDYIDELVGRLWPEIGRYRGRYERALKQRNNILRLAAERPSLSLDDQFFVWDIKLAEYAALLVEGRQKLIASWNNRLSEVYSYVAHKPSRIDIFYKSDSGSTAYQSQLLHQLTANRQRDIERGFTSVGPHRDDITIMLEGTEAALSASRGEVRTLILSLKVIELQLLEEVSQRPPILLLDDVFSELDVTRRKAISQLSERHQTIITTTDADVIVKDFTGSFMVIEPLAS